MSIQTQLKSLFKGKQHFGGLLRGKNALRGVVAVLAIITMGGFLASNTDSIVAQQEDIGIQVIAVGGTVPVIVGEFDTGSLESTEPILGSNSPTGLAYNTTIDAYAIVDNSKDEVYIVGSDGNLQAQFNTSGFSTNPQGIAYDSANNRYVISDTSADELFFVTTAGVQLFQCDTSGFATSPIGVAFNSSNGFYAIVDNNLDEVFVVDSSCAIQHQFDTAGDGLSAPTGITYRPDTDQYEVVGSFTDDIFIFDATVGVTLGDLDNRFDIGANSINAPGGIAYNPDDRVSAVSDTTWDQIFPIDHRGTLVNTFDIGFIGNLDASDLTLNTATGHLLVLDDMANFVYTFTPAGAFVTICSVGTIGATNAWGLAYLAATNQLAIADQSDDEVYITSTSCVLSSTFDTATKIHSETPTGLGMDLIFGGFTLTDSSDDQIRYTDTAGNLKGSCPGAILGFDGGNGTGPTDGMFAIQDIDHISSAGNFAVVDSGDDEVVVFNTLCLPVLHFDTGGLKPTLGGGLATTPEGIAIDNVAKRIYIADSNTDEVYELDLPRVFEATTISGSFFAPGLATLNIKDNGDGFWSGTAVVAESATLFGTGIQSHAAGIDISGTFDKSALTLDLMIELGGTPTVFSFTVGADLNTINLGPSTFTRQ